MMEICDISCSIVAQRRMLHIGYMKAGSEDEDFRSHVVNGN